MGKVFHSPRHSLTPSLSLFHEQIALVMWKVIIIIEALNIYTPLAPATEEAVHSLIVTNGIRSDVYPDIHPILLLTTY